MWGFVIGIFVYVLVDIVRFVSTILSAEDCECVKFHEEIHVWQQGVDPEQGQRLLKDAYQEAQEHPAQRLVIGHWLFGCCEAVLSRKWKFLFTRLGDVCQPILPLRYAETSVPNFSNSYSEPSNFRLGEKHVVVGFVDLGILRTAMISESDSSLTSRICDSESTIPSVVWTGYEASAFCVAKTLCVLKVLQNEASEVLDRSQSPPRKLSALEIWYSASWLPSTARAFRRAVSQLLAHPPRSSLGLTTHKKAVRTILEMWRDEVVIPLSQARSYWQSNPRRGVKLAALAPNFVQPVDRAALCAYSLTGDLFPAAADSVGSTPMWSFGERSRRSDDTVFNVVPLVEIIQRRREGSATCLMESVRSYLLEGVDRLRDYLDKGMLRVDLRYGAVEPGSDAIDHIRYMQPKSISWNNVLDYMKAEVFHQLASNISIGDATQHIGYSMNWPIWTAGCSFLDTFLPAARKVLMQECTLELQQELQVLQEGYQLLRTPPAVSIDNGAGIILLQRYYLQWIQEFFKRGPRATVSHWQPRYNFLARQHAEVQLSWYYHS